MHIIKLHSNSIHLSVSKPPFLSPLLMTLGCSHDYSSCLNIRVHVSVRSENQEQRRPSASIHGCDRKQPGGLGGPGCLSSEKQRPPLKPGDPSCLSREDGLRCLFTPSPPSEIRGGFPHSMCHIHFNRITCLTFIFHHRRRRLAPPHILSPYLSRQHRKQSSCPRLLLDDSLIYVSHSGRR